MQMWMLVSCACRQSCAFQKSYAEPVREAEINAEFSAEAKMLHQAAVPARELPIQGCTATRVSGSPPSEGYQCREF